MQTLSGNSADARCYLIDAERLLRLRGLTKREVSRRARLLHHVYTWLRIIGESTFTLHDYDNSGLREKIEKAARNNRGVPDTSPISEQGSIDVDEHSQLDDFLRVETHGTDSDSDVDASKDQTAGLRDIHLADLRKWSKTLYMDIYGIPEIWLSLVSQTTRVANIMDFLQRNSIQAAPVFSNSLQKKISRLEHMICSLSAQYSGTRSLSPPGDGNNQSGTATLKPSPAGQAMLRALGSALVILFYRRIRKVHPWILQSHVMDVSAALKEFDLAQGGGTGTLGTPWPAFIAGCEAMSSSSRDWFMKWMQKGAERSAFNGFTQTQQVMREVWERRDAAGNTASHKRGEVYSWVDVLQEGRLWVMLY